MIYRSILGTRYVITRTQAAAQNIMSRDKKNKPYSVRRAHRTKVRQTVAVAHVEKRPIHHRSGQVELRPAVVVQSGVDGVECRAAPVIAHPRPGPVPCQEGVTSAGDGYVRIPIQRQLNGTIRQLGRDCRRRRYEDAARLFPPKTTPHALHPHNHLSGGGVRPPGAKVLRLGGCLGGRIDGQLRGRLERTAIVELGSR